jgi:uncharacterized membrane protein YhaH (DUF805 family)
MFCSNCGEKLDEGAMFCTKCGAKVEEAASDNQNSQLMPQQQINVNVALQNAVANGAEAHSQSKNAWQYFCDAFRKYAVFKGRARRSEFWFFYLFYILFNFVAMFIDNILHLRFSGTIFGGTGLIQLLWSLASLIPNLSLSWRRMHDVNRCGAFCLIPIYNIVLLVTEGDKGENRFGPDPKAI